MELTLDQALQKGIEAHKAGNVQEADRYYTAILKANPKHPDASHNMGVLAVGLGKVEEALPFFKTAIEANPSIPQFWLSYIDTLIKLNRIEDAKAVFDRAKSKGLEDENFGKVETMLNQTNRNSELQNPQSYKLHNLINLYNEHQFQAVLDQASKLLLEFPKSTVLHTPCANQGLKSLMRQSRV